MNGTSVNNCKISILSLAELVYDFKIILPISCKLEKIHITFNDMIIYETAVINYECKNTVKLPIFSTKNKALPIGLMGFTNCYIHIQTRSIIKSQDIKLSSKYIYLPTNDRTDFGQNIIEFTDNKKKFNIYDGKCDISHRTVDNISHTFINDDWDVNEHIISHSINSV